MLVADGQVLLQLHHADAHEHPHMGQPGAESSGDGVLLWFQTDEFDAAVERARALGARVLQEPRVNPNARHRELWIRDPDGYTVVLAGKRGDLGS
jgi:predicted enzyme related to lactoylglutathione lyase